MSNARYFAQGTDFYRVLYDSGNIDGPYIKASSARSVGERAIRVRSSGKYWTMHNGQVVNEWQDETGYKIQKLEPIALRSSDHLGLEWMDCNG